jgi:methylenetetrahydrofolate dehydrogenase (NADP+)/methenyltetrahydrofolate cyclohydrolase
MLHKDTPEQMKYEILREADVIISATGQIYVVDTHVHPLKRGVVLVDVGFTRVVSASTNSDETDPHNNNNNHHSYMVDIVAGDIHPRCYPLSLAYTPVPGGVGPVTVACLLRNILKAATTLHN